MRHGVDPVVVSLIAEVIELHGFRDPIMPSSQVGAFSASSLGSALSSHRVLVLGASGWFGKSFVQALPSDVATLQIAGRKRGPYQIWDPKTVKHFAPTMVANFAFLRPSFEAILGTVRYESTNRRLISIFSESALLPTVRSVLVTSSGAVSSSPLSLYGRLKAEEESAAEDAQSKDRSVVRIRVYSVSGPFVRDIEHYAFSSLVSQAPSGEITVNSNRRVFRRYVDATDVLQVGVRLLNEGWSGCIETGGPIVELGDLADLVAAELNPQARIRRPPLDPNAPDDYYASDDTTWTEACRMVDWEPLSLRGQVRRTAIGLGVRLVN